jgi:hypothetical protein
MKLLRANTIKKVASRTQGFFAYPKLVTALFLLTVALLTTRIYFSNQLAISGERVSIHERKIEELKEENAQLENQLSQKSSLSYIESKANEIGLIKTGKVELIKVGSPVALGQ